MEKRWGEGGTPRVLPRRWRNHEFCWKKVRANDTITSPSTYSSNNVDLEISGVFRNEPVPNILKRASSQLSWMLENDPNGGYWITFGQLNK